MSKNLPKNILNRLKTIKKKSYISLHEPSIDFDEINEVKKTLQRNEVSSYGKTVSVFENIIRDFTKSKYAISTINGTSGIHLSLLALGVKKEDEILVPSLTFIGTINAIKFAGANPHFIDSNPIDLGVDHESLEIWLNRIVKFKNGFSYNKNTNKRIFAIIPVHIFGHSVQINKIKKICKKFNLKLIEDAAEALGSYNANKHLGLFGDVGVISFNGNKIITTGNGGVVLTSNKNLEIKIRKLSNTAKTKHSWKLMHEMESYNYRMSSINASLGIAQFKKLKKHIHRKRKLNDFYINLFKDVMGVSIFKEPSYSKSNYWLNVLMLDKPDMKLRDEILDITNKNKIHTRPCWFLNHRYDWLKKYPRSPLNNAIELEKKIICIPSSPNIL